MERRDFLKLGCVGASAAVVAGLAGCAPQTKSGPTELAGTSASDVNWTDEYDVVVVGGGGAGFCAAIEAAEAGASVVILEKSGTCGGDTALSNGMILGAGTPQQAELEGCTDDSGEKFAEEQIAYAQGFGDEDMIREMCMESAAAVEWLVNDCGRVYATVDVVAPVNAYTDEFYPRSHWDYYALTASIRGEETDPTATHFGCLQKKADTYENITVKTNTEAVHLITEGKEVVGVQTADDDFFKAAKGVILATCSIGDNMEMARALNPQQYWGLYQREVNGAPVQVGASPYNTGDGIRMGLEVGAARAAHLGALVPGQAEPVHGPQDDLGVLLGGALRVGVLDAQDEGAAGGAGEGPVVDGSAGAADVQLAGGRRCEANAHRLVGDGHGTPRNSVVYGLDAIVDQYSTAAARGPPYPNFRTGSDRRPTWWAHRPGPPGPRRPVRCRPRTLSQAAAASSWAGSFYTIRTLPDKPGCNHDSGHCRRQARGARTVSRAMPTLRPRHPSCGFFAIIPSDASVHHQFKSL